MLGKCESQMPILSILRSLARDENGATLVEYALIIGVLSMMIVLAANNLLSSNGVMWTYVLNHLDAVF